MYTIICIRLHDDTRLNEESIGIDSFGSRVKFYRSYRICPL